MVETDFSEQSLKAQSSFGRGPALALIVVDDENSVRRPTELDGPIDEPVLAVGGFLVLGDLLGGGLADVDDGQPVEMPRLDFGKTRASKPTVKSSRCQRRDSRVSLGMERVE